MQDHLSNNLFNTIKWLRFVENFLKNDEFYDSIKRIAQLLGKQLPVDWRTTHTPETNTEAEDGK